jgi:hypothetical protein
MLKLCLEALFIVDIPATPRESLVPLLGRGNSPASYFHCFLSVHMPAPLRASQGSGKTLAFGLPMLHKLQYMAEDESNSEVGQPPACLY